MRRQSSFDVSFGPGPMTPGVKLLLISNVAVFLLTRYLLRGVPWDRTFGLVPELVTHLHFWQVFTYLFLHGSFWHLFMNMFVLWMFGVTLERSWGTDLFLKYYFVVGVGAGIATWLTTFGSTVPTIGASGATIGLLVAFAVMYPNQPILLAFLFPIPAKIFVLIYAGLEFLSASQYVHDGVAHTTHLAGMAIGFLYLRSDLRPKQLLARWRRRAQSRRLRIVRLGDEDRRTDVDEAEIDAILDKISREGIDSLTEAEVRKLRERSSS